MFTTIRTNNQINTIGRIARIKSFKDVSIVTVAVDNGKDKEGNEIKSTFIDFKCFDDKTVKNLEQGMLVNVFAHFKNNNYEKNGEMVYAMDFVIDTIVYLESKATVEARKAAKATA